MPWKLWRSLRTRVTLAVLVIFLCSVVLLSLIASRLLHSEMQRLLGDQQAATVSLVAADISGNLQVRQNALDKIASAIGGAVLDNPASVQQLLEQRMLIQLLFNAGAFVTRLDGTAMAEVPLTGRIGLNYLDNDHIATAIKTGQASLGRPVVSERLHTFAMTVPIRDAQGKVIGAVSGMTDLSQPNFLDGIHAGSYGNSGGYLLVAPQHRLFVTATANFKELIMQPLPAPGVNPVLDKRILGFDGPAVNVSHTGIEVLTSSARIPLAGWFLIASLPTKEAFVPVDTLEKIILSVATILTLLSGILIWAMLRHLLSPLQTASKTLSNYADRGETALPLPIAQHDEVGVLVGSFNRVLEVSTQRETRLRESEEKFRHFFEKNSSVQLLIDPGSFVIENANRAAIDYYGYPQDQLIGMCMSNILLPHRMAEEMMLALQDEKNLFQHRLASGDVRSVEVHATPIVSEGHALIFAIIHDITGRLKAQAQLAQVTSEQAAILNSNINGIAKIRDRHFVWINNACASMLGYTVDELMGQPTRIIYPSDNAYLAFAAQAHPVMQSGGVFRTEIQFLLKDNTLRWFDMCGQLLCPGSDESIGSLVDISERIHNEIALRDSQDRLIHAQEGAHVGVWEVNYATNTTYWSPECENLYGLEPGALTCADDWRARVHPDDLPLIDAQLANITNHCESLEVEYRFRTDNYGNRWFLSKGRVQYDSNHLPLKLSGINLDVTDRKQMSAERDRLLRIIEEAPEYIGMIDMQMRFVFLNKAALKMVGLPDDTDVSTLKITDLRPEWALHHIINEVIPAALSEGFWQGETLLLHRDGYEIPVYQLLFVQRDTFGKPEYLATIMHDISRQKALMSELTLAKEAAEAATIAKSRFLATMSHEIRTPMNGILGMSQLLLMPNWKDDERRDYAQTIFTCGETLMALLNDILDLSKIEAGKFQLDVTAFDPEALLHETHALFTSAGQAKNLQFEFHWHGLPGQHYNADALRVRQMLSNLISNAIKFTKHGHVSVQGMELARDGDSALLEFSVSDTGIGIAADKMHLLFKPFSQTDSSTTREYGGSGLGLSIVSNLAKAMGGDVGCESCVGQGSRFWFRLRAQCLAVDARQSDLLPETKPAHLVQLRGHVLVAEDNVVNGLVIKSFLDKLGLHSTLTQNGQQTVTTITEGSLKPDIILMDLSMPVMDGYETTVQIRQWETENQQPHLPIIALTADAFDEDRQYCQAVGMDDFLTKPIELDALTSTLAKWLLGSG